MISKTSPTKNFRTLDMKKHNMLGTFIHIVTK